MKEPVKKYIIPEDFTTTQLIEIIKPFFKVQEESKRKKTLTFYDTFDWRFYNKSKVLVQKNNHYYIRQLYQDNILSSIELEGEFTLENINDGEFKKMLEKIMLPRKLFRLGTINLNANVFKVLNEDEKTIAKIYYNSYYPALSSENTKGINILQVQSVRGYKKEFSRIKKEINNNNYLSNSKYDILHFAAELVNKKPGDYSSKTDIPIHAAMQSIEALQSVFQTLYSTIRMNEPFVLKDQDTEFLHDYRVAIRKTRSALSQIKDVMSPEHNLRFKKVFSFIGKKSNNLRDLDVFLLNEQKYRSLITDELQKGYNYIVKSVIEKRKQAFEKFKEEVTTDSYQKKLIRWEVFLESMTEKAMHGPQASINIKELANTTITSQYSKVIDYGMKVLETHDTNELHNLRIECKKLRYLLEFFKKLYPPEKINKLIKQLKKIQDSLGLFNDLSVHMDFFMELTETIQGNTQQKKQALVTAGYLVGLLRYKLEDVKNEFYGKFIKFNKQENNKLFIQLFN